VLHRDVKPSNILLTPDGQVFLADFGLARIAQAGESTLSQDALVGTPQYISPEQARGDPVLDVRTDIYSFGVVMYELLIGRVPYQADTPYAVIHDHIYAPLPLPRSIKPGFPESLERVLLKALAKQCDDRYASVAELMAAFESAADDHSKRRHRHMACGCSTDRSGGRPRSLLLARRLRAPPPKVKDALVDLSGDCRGDRGRRDRAAGRAATDPAPPPDLAPLEPTMQPTVSCARAIRSPGPGLEFRRLKRRESKSNSTCCRKCSPVAALAGQSWLAFIADRAQPHFQSWWHGAQNAEPLVGVAATTCCADGEGQPDARSRDPVESRSQLGAFAEGLCAHQAE
jgi:hypothetical protein